MTIRASFHQLLANMFARFSDFVRMSHKKLLGKGLSDSQSADSQGWSISESLCRETNTSIPYLGMEA